MPAGLLSNFFREVAELQQRELRKQKENPKYEPRLRIAIVTARNAPAHKRVVTTLREWGIEVDETFFLGGIDKTRTLKEFRPHIFFDDQLAHIEGAMRSVPSVHVPFCIANFPEPMDEEVTEAHEEDGRRRK